MNRSQAKDSECLDTRESARLLGLSPRTLEKWRYEGSGPPFLKMGRRVLYTKEDLVAWMYRRRCHSTSEWP